MAHTHSWNLDSADTTQETAPDGGKSDYLVQKFYCACGETKSTKELVLYTPPPSKDK